MFYTHSLYERDVRGKTAKSRFGGRGARYKSTDYAIRTTCFRQRSAAVAVLLVHTRTNTAHTSDSRARYNSPIVKRAGSFRGGCCRLHRVLREFDKCDKKNKTVCISSHRRIGRIILRRNNMIRIEIVGLAGFT